MSFFTGTPGKFSQQSLLTPGQQGLQNGLQNSAQGSFGQAGNYYNSLFNDNNDTFNSLANPEMRRYNEQIIPDLAEQFAGFGSGSLSSSGFRNAATSAGTDLSERLGAIRAQLRQQGAQGLMGLGQKALQPTVENIYTQGQPGLLDSIGSGIGGAAAGFAMGGPAGAIGGGLNGLVGNKNQSVSPQQPTAQKGTTGPYQPSSLNNGFNQNAIQFGQQPGGYNPMSPLR